MAAQQMDAVTSFVYLIDNIPSWMTQIESLTNHAIKKNTEFIAEYDRLVNQIRPQQKRKRSPSMQSIHSDRDGAVEKDANRSPSLEKAEINPFEPGNKYLYAQAQRRRKPDSSMRSGASGLQRYRNRNHVVIYYDSYLQENLDTLVKSFGVARNNLRKGKNALVAMNGFQLPSLKKRYDSTAMSASLENIKKAATTRNTTMAVGSKYPHVQRQPQNEDEAAFASTDRSLESVQGFCETAAHQFLRDGDCKVELDASLAQLRAISEQAKVILESLKQKASLKEQPSGVDDYVSDISPVPTISDYSPIGSDRPLVQPRVRVHRKHSHGKMVPKIRAPHPDLSKGAPPPPIPNIPTIPTVPDLSSLPTAGIEIEVDDTSDLSDIEVDLSKYRAGNRPRIGIAR